MRNDDKSVGRMEPSSSKRFLSGTAEANDGLEVGRRRPCDELCDSRESERDDDTDEPPLELLETYTVSMLYITKS